MSPVAPRRWSYAGSWYAVRMVTRCGYRIAADHVVAVHLLFISFVVGGVFLAWRWPRILWAHLPAVVYWALVAFTGCTCPLTPLGESPAPPCR